MLKKIGIGVGILAAVVVIGGSIYFCFIARNPYKYKPVAKNINEQPSDTSTTEIANDIKDPVTKSVALTKKLNDVPDKALEPMPTIKVTKKDADIELSGAKVSPEELPTTTKAFTGAVIKPEYCWIKNEPTKSILAQNIVCVDGIIDLTDYGLPGVEANIKVGKNEKGEDCVFLSDEKGKNVGFKFASSSGTMFGRQKLSTVKVFALGFRRTLDEPVFVVMMCSNALLKGGEGKISLAPRIDNLPKQSVRQVLEELYLDQEDIDYLFPASEKVALK